MSQEIVKILRVETQGSERTVKSLKDEISALKDALLNTEKGTKTYDDIVKQLKSDYNDLSTVMNAGKKDVEALEGSYNYLVKTMGELKKEWRATTDEVRRNQLGQEIDNINTQLKEMDASIGNYQRNVGNYTESFSDAMKQQQEATEVTRAKFEAISKVATGLASGYAAVQGAMAIMGVENEKLEKTFVKLQAAIALAQGIGGLKDLVEGLGLAKVAFKGCQLGAGAFIGTMSTMKAALVGTGIGAFVIAIGSLVQYLMTLEDEAEDTTTALEKLNAEIEKSNRQLKWGDAKEDTKILKDYIKAVEEAGNDINKLKQAEADYKKALQANTIADAEKAYDEAKRIYDEAHENYYAEDNKSKSTIDYPNKLSKEELEELFKQLLELETNLAEAEKKMYEARAKAPQDSANAAIKTAEETAKAKEDIEKERIKKQEDAEKERLKVEKENAVQAEKEKQEAIDAIIKEYAEKRADIDTEKNFREQEIDVKYDGMATDDPVQSIQLEIDKLDELRQLRFEIHNEKLAQINEVLLNEIISGEEREKIEKERMNLIRQNAIEEQRYNAERAKSAEEKAKSEKEAQEAAKKRAEAEKKAKIMAVKTTLSNVSTLMKEGSKEQKGILSAIATMEALEAANGAYAAMSGIKIVGPALGIAAAAAALAAGYANVKAIWAVDEDGSNTSALTGNASVTPTFNAEQAMPVQYTRELLTDNETDKLNQTTKVVVLESDIREAHKKVDVIESNASF